MKEVSVQDQELPAETDVIIIGSGIVGLSTAFYLKKLGVSNVTVFDRGPIGGVASPRAAGNLRHHYTDPLLVELAVRSHKFFKHFREHTGGDCGYVQNGYLLGIPEDKAEWLVDNIEMVRSVGVNTALTTHDEVRSLFPEVDQEGWSGLVAYDRDGGYAQPQDTMRELSRAVREQGTTLVPGVEVTGLDIENGIVRGVVTETGSHVRARVVLNATGAWGAKVAALAGIDLPIEVGRLLQIAELRPGFRVPVDRPTISESGLDFYARPNPGNRLLLGARHYFDGPQNPDDIALYPVHETVLSSRKQYERLVPETQTAAVYQAWAGIDGDTPDFQPVVGPMPGVSGFLTAAGFSGGGFKMGPIIGELMSEMIVHGEYRTLDISRLGFERFENGNQFPLGYRQMGG